MCKAKSEGGFRCASEAKSIRKKLMLKLEPHLSSGSAYTLSTPLASVINPVANELLDKAAKNEVLSSAPSEKDLRKAWKAREYFRATGDLTRIKAMEEAYTAARSHRDAISVRSILSDYSGRYKAGERLGLLDRVEVGSTTIISEEQALSLYKTRAVAETALAKGNVFIEGTLSAKKALESEHAKAKMVFRALVSEERLRILAPYVSAAA